MALFQKNRRTEKFKEFIELDKLIVPYYYPLELCKQITYTEEFLGPFTFTIQNSDVIVQDKANLILQFLIAYEYLGGKIPKIIYNTPYIDNISLAEFKDLVIEHLPPKLVNQEIDKEALKDITLLVYDVPLAM